MIKTVQRGRGRGGGGAARRGGGAGARKGNNNSFKFNNDEEIAKLQAKYAEIGAAEAPKRFADFPLSQKTLRALQEAKYINATEIQRGSIGPALQGKDVLGAAITGSGKTLAFLIPVLEHFFLAKWSRTDGVAAIIISPTRELAYQIFETLKKVGKYHDFSAGLIIGGKNLKFERSRMDQCNILICTPGRLLQHMDENPLFNASTIEMLVLDEADRCLDMGFEQALNAIVENLPPGRQTLLFSATQTSSLKDLARLNLRDPIYIGHSSASPAAAADGSAAPPPPVPDLLQQNYVVIALEDKLTMLWSFIKNHQKQKIIVFLSSCKQVKYVFEVFCKLRPGTSLLALYGTLHQDRRIAIYNDFVRKSNVVLFATDIASRGLDFPSVNWVVQLDCPEDVTQYIHRAGRSARNKTRGESLLVLLPTEEPAMIEALDKRNINVRQIHIDPKKLFSPRFKIESYLAQNTELKASAQRAFVSYIKSVFLMKNKNIFRVLELNFDTYAKSLGLAVTPRVRFLDRYLKRQQQAAGEASNIDNDDSAEPSVAVKTKVSLGSNNFNAHSQSDSESEDDDDFIKVKRIDHAIRGAAADALEDLEEEELPLLMPRKEKLVTKAAVAKKAIKKKIQVNEKRKFDEDGREILDARKQMQSAMARDYEENAAADDAGGIDIARAKQLLSEEDKFDKQRFRELVKQRHKKLKEKVKNRADECEGIALGGSSDKGDDGDDSSEENSVDLSWLPDPKKVYKSASRNDASASSASESDDSEDERYVPNEDNLKNNSNDVDFYDEEEEEQQQPASKKLKMTSKLSLSDAEVIAAQLLANST